MPANVPSKRRGTVKLPLGKPAPGAAAKPPAAPAKPAPPAAAKEPPPEVWRISRVAKALDVRPKRVYRLVSEGKLEAVRLGPRCLRVFRKSVEECLAALAREAEAGD